MAKYVKLGTKAQDGSFYDPVSQLNLAPGMVAKVPKEASQSRLYKEALHGQHIVEATEDEYDEYMESVSTKKEQDKKTSKKAKAKPGVEEDEDDEDAEDDDATATEDDDEEDEDDEDEDDVDTMTKGEFLDALRSSDKLTEEDKKNLSKMDKAALKELYLKTVKK